VAKVNTQCAKAFNTITAKAAEIPTKTADRKINCLSPNFDLDQAIVPSIWSMIFLNMVFFFSALNYN
jgi:hypothetical protein